jgi:predicted RNA methylase
VDKRTLEIAKENVKIAQRISGIKIGKLIRWRCENVENLKEKCDTVIQFPPFKLDMVFLKKALEMATDVFSLHASSSEKEDCIKKVCEEFGAKIIRVERFKYYFPEEYGYQLLLVVAKK